MPIFSSQLGKVEEQNPEKAVKTLANHLRKIQEELEYRLMNLDSSNINEIDADITNITKGGKPFTNTVTGETGDYSELEQTVEGLRSTVFNNAGYISQLQQTAASITTQVQTLDGRMTIWEQTADSITSQVSALDGRVSTLQQTAAGFGSQVSDLNGRMSTVEQTAENLRIIVENIETGEYTGLRMDPTGVYIVDQNGNQVRIHGGQIDANSLNLKGHIAFSDLSDGNSVLGSINTAYNLADSAYGLAEAAYNLAENGEWPDYIHNTFISNVEVRSPSIYGGMFYATGRGRYTEAAFYLYDSWSASKGLGNQVGYLSYDDDGAGTAEEAAKRVLLTSTNGTALKLNAAGNMSLEAGNRIYMMTTTVYGAPILLTSGYGFGTALPSSGTPGQLFFLR